MDALNAGAKPPSCAQPTDLFLEVDVEVEDEQVDVEVEDEDVKVEDKQVWMSRPNGSTSRLKSRQNGRLEDSSSSNEPVRASSFLQCASRLCTASDRTFCAWL